MNSQNFIKQMSQTSINKFTNHAGGLGKKLALAPKIKGGAMPMNKRNTDFPAHAGSLGILD